MKNEQPKTGRPGASGQWPRWEGFAEMRPSGYLQGDDDVFAKGQQQDNTSEEPHRSDDRIAREVDEQLSQDAVLDPASLTMWVDNGEVTLEGYVARLVDKTRAEEIVLDIDGVTACRNNLRIAPERH